jgi:hypothetical protein
MKPIYLNFKSVNHARSFGKLFRRVCTQIKKEKKLRTLPNSLVMTLMTVDVIS